MLKLKFNLGLTILIKLINYKLVDYFCAGGGNQYSWNNPAPDGVHQDCKWSNTGGYMDSRAIKIYCHLIKSIWTP